MNDKKSIILIYHKDTDIVTFDYFAACGQRFSNVITVFDPLSVNPGMSLNGTALGISAVKQALMLLDKWKIYKRPMMKADWE
jgi:hypothetical protein